MTTGIEHGSPSVVDILPLVGTVTLFESVEVPLEVLSVAVGDTPSHNTFRYIQTLPLTNLLLTHFIHTLLIHTLSLPHRLIDSVGLAVGG